MSDAVFEGLHAKERGGGRVVSYLLRHLLISLHADCVYVYTLSKDKSTWIPAFFDCLSHDATSVARDAGRVVSIDRSEGGARPLSFPAADEPWPLDRVLKGEIVIIERPGSRERSDAGRTARGGTTILVPMARRDGRSRNDKGRRRPGRRSGSKRSKLARHREGRGADASRSAEKLRPGGDAGRRRRVGKRHRGVEGVLAIEGGPADLSDTERGLLGTTGAMLAALLAARLSRRALKADNRALLRHMRTLPREAESHRLVAEGLRDILVVLNSNRSLAGILEYLVTRGQALLSADACVLYRLHRDQQTIVIEARTGLPEALAAFVELPLDLSEPPEVESFQGPILSPVSFIRFGLTPSDTQRMGPNDIAGSAVQAWIGALARHYHTLLSVPLVVKDSYYGNVGLYYTTPRSFSKRDASLAVSFASQAALAIENAQLRVQAEHAAVLQERGRLARDLHDSVTQSLYSLTLLAEAARRLAGAGDLSQVQNAIARLGEIGQQALKEMRLLVYELRPLALRREGLVRALTLRMETVERRAGVDARLMVEGELALSPALEEQLYHLVQEALNNTLKHAAATAVTVRFERAGERLQVEVADNGRGFDLEQPGQGGGMGLLNIRERVERLGGIFAIESQAGQGTRISVSLDLASNKPGSREPLQRAMPDPEVNRRG